MVFRIDSPRRDVPMRAALLGIAFLLFAWCLLLHPAFANEKGLELGSPSPTLLAKLEPYLRIRDARLVGWLSPEQGLLITTRLDEFRQLHAVEMPGGMRRQLTFYDDSVDRTALTTTAGRSMVALTMVRHPERIMLFDVRTGGTRFLTNDGGEGGDLLFSHDGRRLVLISRAEDEEGVRLRILDPFTGEGPFGQLEGDGRWRPLDWSPDDSKLLLRHTVSPVESELWLVEVPSLSRHLLRESSDPVAYGPACFDAKGEGVFFVCDQWRGIKEIAHLRLNDGKVRRLSDHLGWDVQELALSPDGKRLAFSVNENGTSRLYLLPLEKKARPQAVDLPTGVLGKLTFQPRQKATPQLAFEMTTPVSPWDVYVLRGIEGHPQLLRWTASETGGLNPEDFARPDLIYYRTFDQGRSGGTREIPALYYRPGGAGPHAVVIDLRGGQGSQSRPSFAPRREFWVRELGLAVLAPNLRGSSGYGREFIGLGGAAHREELVRDLIALLDWIEKRPELDSSRVGVYGEGEGGVIARAAMAVAGERIKAGVNVLTEPGGLDSLNPEEEYSSPLLFVEGREFPPGKVNEWKEMLQTLLEEGADFAWAGRENAAEAEPLAGLRSREGAVAEFWLTRLVRGDTP